MQIVNSILASNPCYKAGRKITVKGFMLHSVGCSQPDAQVFIRLWNKSTFRSSCVHGIVDANTGVVYQTLPWNHRGWHCGSGSKGSANNTHIGVEMCEPSVIKYTSGSNFTCAADKLEVAQTAAKKTYQSAVELAAMLCEKYSLDPLGDGVIISHAEGNKRQIATAHADPEHLWKQLGLAYTMDGFRSDVMAAMKKTTTVADATKKEETISPFFIRVPVSNLKIRKGPGTNYGTNGKYTGKGIFTIVEKQEGEGSENGWGLLKGYAKQKNGWVNLDYCTKI